MKKEDLVDTAYSYLLEFFEDYNYKKPKVSKERLLYFNPSNVCGHQQRTFLMWWALKVSEEEVKKGKDPLILDIGCGQAITPSWGIGIDKVHGIHPAYGDLYIPTIQASGSILPIRNKCISAIVSNHAIEHMDAKKAFYEWIRVLKPGGIIALVTPDITYGPHQDPDGHVREYTPGEFFDEILAPLVEDKKIRILELDSFDNYFSWNLVVEKRNESSNNAL